MRTRVLGLSIGALTLAGACATSTATQSRSALEVVPAPEVQQRSASVRGAFDSLYVQSVAGREGPRVGIRAQVTQLASTRRLRAVFNVEDDAYVMVGHVDAAGVLRVVFPADPRDDGFVQGGGRTYETPEFFGGFPDQYTFRYSNYGRYSGTQPQAYDGGGGYLFIVASWRPMHFDKFSSGDAWDSFEMTNEAYVRDPRPAIRELASVLAGENRDEYTVEFASYFNSQNLSPFASYSSASAFGLGLCNASYFGWGGSIPWSYLSTNAPFLTTGFGRRSFVYRGRPYAYDALGDCAVPLPYGYSFYGVPRIASLPVVPGKPSNPITGRTRMLSAFDSPRNPFDPRPKGGRVAPNTARDGPRVEQRTERRSRESHEGTGYTNTRVAPRRGDDSPRTSAPAPRTESRRTAPPPERRSEPRSAPPMRRARPRSSEPRSSEPRSSEPRSTSPSKPTTPPASTSTKPTP